jgi:hypothetical protein
MAAKSKAHRKRGRVKSPLPRALIPIRVGCACSPRIPDELGPWLAFSWGSLSDLDPAVLDELSF